MERVSRDDRGQSSAPKSPFGNTGLTYQTDDVHYSCRPVSCRVHYAIFSSSHAHCPLPDRLSPSGCIRKRLECAVRTSCCMYIVCVYHYSLHTFQCFTAVRALSPADCRYNNIIIIIFRLRNATATRRDNQSVTR